MTKGAVFWEAHSTTTVLTSNSYSNDYQVSKWYNSTVRGDSYDTPANYDVLAAVHNVHSAAAA
jgi:hypothetical protein